MAAYLFCMVIIIITFSIREAFCDELYSDTNYEYDYGTEIDKKDGIPKLLGKLENQWPSLSESEMQSSDSRFKCVEERVTIDLEKENFRPSVFKAVYCRNRSVPEATTCTQKGLVCRQGYRDVYVGYRQTAGRCWPAPVKVPLPNGCHCIKG